MLCLHRPYFCGTVWAVVKVTVTGSILVVPRISCVTLSKLLEFSGPPFHYLQNGNNNSTYFIELWEFNRIVQMFHLTFCINAWEKRFPKSQSYNDIYLYLKWSESRSVMSSSLWPHGYTVHGILQARILEWVAVPFSKGSFHPRDWTQVSCIAGGFFTSWATREAFGYLIVFIVASSYEPSYH